MRKMLFLFSAIILLFTLSACNETNDGESPEIEKRVIPVESIHVETGDLIIEQTVFGHTMPNKQTPVLVQQPGEITDLKVKNGDTVKKDERIGTIKTEMGSFAIKSPVAGEVGLLKLEKDDFYNGEEPIAIIFDAEIVAVQFFATPEMKSKFKEDKKYKTVIDEKEYDAEVKRIERLPNESGQYEIVAHINNEKGHILPGSIAEISLKNVTKKDALLIPTEAIISDSDETYVFIVDGSTAKKVNIEILETQTEQSAVKGDLKDKDEVIISGQFLLTDGSEIEVVKEGK